MPERCCIHNAVGNASVQENLNESIVSVTAATNGAPLLAFRKAFPASAEYGIKGPS
jgi:hypothetical protein